MVWICSVRKQVVNIPSYVVRLDSQKHIDFTHNSPYGCGRPGTVHLLIFMITFVLKSDWPPNISWKNAPNCHCKFVKGVALISCLKNVFIIYLHTSPQAVSRGRTCARARVAVMMRTRIDLVQSPRINCWILGMVTCNWTHSVASVFGKMFTGTPDANKWGEEIVLLLLSINLLWLKKTLNANLSENCYILICKTQVITFHSGSILFSALLTVKLLT